MTWKALGGFPEGAEGLSVLLAGFFCRLWSFLEPSPREKAVERENLCPGGFPRQIVVALASGSISCGWWGPARRRLDE